MYSCLFLHTSVDHRCSEFWVSQVILVIKNLSVNAGDLRDVGSVPGLGRSCGGGHSNPIQYSCLEDPMDRGTWLATVYRVTKRVRHDLPHLSLLLFFPSCPIDLYFCLCDSTILCASTILITVTLWYSMKSGSLIPPAPFLFPMFGLVTQGLLCFHTCFNVFFVCSSSVKNGIRVFIWTVLNL